MPAPVVVDYQEREKLGIESDTLAHHVLEVLLHSHIDGKHTDEPLQRKCDVGKRPPCIPEQTDSFVRVAEEDQVLNVFIILGAYNRRSLEDGLHILI